MATRRQQPASIGSFGTPPPHIRVALGSDVGRGATETGVGRYVSRLAHALQTASHLSPEIQVTPLPFSAPSNPPLSTVNRWFTARRISKHFDLVHWPDLTAPPTIPSERLVVTAHDLIVLDRPDLVPPARRLYKAALARDNLIRASGVLCVSKFTLQQIAMRYPHLAGKLYFVGGASAVDVAPLSLYTNHRPSTVKGLLFVGTLCSQKIPLSFLQGLFAAWNHGMPYPMTFVGRPGYGSRRILRVLRPWVARGLVSVRGYVDEETLMTLYANSAGLVLPSQYEGMGLPILEAAANGLPVLGSDIPPFREHLARLGSTVTLFDSTNTDSTTDALLTFSHNGGGRRATEIAPTMPSWGEVATSTLGAYHAIASAGV